MDELSFRQRHFFKVASYALIQQMFDSSFIVYNRPLDNPFRRMADKSCLITLIRF